MCKHKSGGMSRPAGTPPANEASGVSSSGSSTGSSSHTTGPCPTASSELENGGSKLPVEWPPVASAQMPVMAVGSQREDDSPSEGAYTDKQAVIRSVVGSETTHVLGSEKSDVRERSNERPAWKNQVGLTMDIPEMEDDVTEQSPMLQEDYAHTFWSMCPLSPFELPAVHMRDGRTDSSEVLDIFSGSRGCTCRESYSVASQEDTYALRCDNLLSKPRMQLQESLKLNDSLLVSRHGGGCAMLLDNSADLIELEEDNTDKMELTRFGGCGCSSKSGRWQFFRHKCRSLDRSCRPARIHKTSSNPTISKLHSCLQASSQLGSDNLEECPTEESCTDSMSTGISIPSVGADSSPGPSGLQRPNSIHGDVEGHRGMLDDDDFRSRSFSLTPTVNFAIFEAESSSEAEDSADPQTKLSDQMVVTECTQLPECHLPNLAARMLPICPSAAQLSLASSLGDSGAPMCKICHMTAKEGDPLISPCRCSGTMQYIHCGCLMRWLEISSKKSRKPPSCELCQYQYQWHKKFKVRHWQFPHCSRRDKILHLLFFVSVLVMVACATITIMCFKQDKGTKMDPERTELTESEIVTLVCGVLFFLAFFVAMYVEVKARNTIYKLMVKFIYLNQQWYIDEYDKKDNGPVSV